MANDSACPWCAETIPQDSRACPYCQGNVAAGHRQLDALAYESTSSSRAAPSGSDRERASRTHAEQEQVRQAPSVGGAVFLILVGGIVFGLPLAGLLAWLTPLHREYIWGIPTFVALFMGFIPNWPWKRLATLGPFIVAGGLAATVAFGLYTSRQPDLTLTFTDDGVNGVHLGQMATDPAVVDLLAQLKAAAGDNSPLAITTDSQGRISLITVYQDKPNPNVLVQYRPGIKVTDLTVGRFQSDFPAAKVAGELYVVSVSGSVATAVVRSDFMTSTIRTMEIGTTEAVDSELKSELASENVSSQPVAPQPGSNPTCDELKAALRAMPDNTLEDKQQFLNAEAQVVAECNPEFLNQPGN